MVTGECIYSSDDTTGYSAVYPGYTPWNWNQIEYHKRWTWMYVPQWRWAYITSTSSLWSVRIQIQICANTNTIMCWYKYNYVLIQIQICADTNTNHFVLIQKNSTNPARLPWMMLRGYKWLEKSIRLHPLSRKSNKYQPPSGILPDKNRVGF